MNEGRYVFSQVVDYIPLYEFKKCVNRYNGNHRVRGLTCYNQFLHLLFGQLTSCTSLRDICLCLKAHRPNLHHLGFGNTVDHTTLSRANENRDYRIYEDFGKYLISIIKPLYQDVKLDDIVADNSIFAIDSTSISVSIKLCSWAFGKYEAGAVKMHTVLSLAGIIPTQIHITDGAWHDSNFLDLLETEINAIYVSDKAYVDLDAMNRIYRYGSYFIMRPKDNMKFQYISEFSQGTKGSEVISDYVVQFAHKKSKQLYPYELRMVKVLDNESKNIITFITNNFEISAEDIANIYRHRWDIEVFFKWIKQNIVIKHLWGYTQNAVKTHLWIAICAYLILARIKAMLQSDYTITEIATLISVSALTKTSLSDLLNKKLAEEYVADKANNLTFKSNLYIKEQPTLFD